MHPCLGLHQSSQPLLLVNGRERRKSRPHMALRVSLALTETSVAHLMVQGTLQKRERMEEPEDKAKSCEMSSPGPDTAMTVIASSGCRWRHWVCLRGGPFAPRHLSEGDLRKPCSPLGSFPLIDSGSGGDCSLHLCTHRWLQHPPMWPHLMIT